MVVNIKFFFATIILAFLFFTNANADKNFRILLQTPQQLTIKYYHSVYKGPGGLERARSLAYSHCESNGSESMYRGRTKGPDRWRTVRFVCIKKAISYEDQKAKAKSECKDLGFRQGTEKFADCVLKLIAKDF